MIFESLTPYTKLIDIFVRDQDTWYDVKMLRSKVGWNNKKIYTGVGLLYKYDMLIKERRSTKSKASFYKFNSESEVGMLVSSLYVKLREISKC